MCASSGRRDVQFRLRPMPFIALTDDVKWRRARRSARVAAELETARIGDGAGGI
jgi:hypothetical protein